MVYWSNSEDQLFQTRVIESSLDPVWGEEFSVNLSVNLMPDTTTINDFPTIYLEVFCASSK